MIFRLLLFVLLFEGSNSFAAEQKKDDQSSEEKWNYPADVLSNTKKKHAGYQIEILNFPAQMSASQKKACKKITLRLKNMEGKIIKTPEALTFAFDSDLIVTLKRCQNPHQNYYVTLEEGKSSVDVFLRVPPSAGTHKKIPGEIRLESIPNMLPMLPKSWSKKFLIEVVN